MGIDWIHSEGKKREKEKKEMKQCRVLLSTELVHHARSFQCHLRLHFTATPPVSSTVWRQATTRK